MLIPALCLTYCAYSPFLTSFQAAVLITFGRCACACVWDGGRGWRVVVGWSVCSVGVCMYTYVSLIVISTSNNYIFYSAISAITVAGVSVSHFDISPKNAGVLLCFYVFMWK